MVKKKFSMLSVKNLVRILNSTWMFMVQEMKIVLLVLMKLKDMINLVMVFLIEEQVSEFLLLV